MTGLTFGSSVFNYDSLHLMLNVYASRSILENEEITISCQYKGRLAPLPQNDANYKLDFSVSKLPLNRHLDTFSERQRNIRNLYGFDCACSKCRQGHSHDPLLFRASQLNEVMKKSELHCSGLSSPNGSLEAAYLEAGLEVLLPPPPFLMSAHREEKARNTTSHPTGVAGLVGV